MTRSSKHNWEAITAEYVEAASDETRPTLEALAAKHKISPSHLRGRAAADKWRDRAAAHIQNIARERQTRKVETIGTDLAEWDLSCLKLTKAAAQQIYNNIKTATDKRETLDLKSIDLLAKSLERLHLLGRTIIADNDPGQDQEAIDAAAYAGMNEEDLAQLYSDRLKKQPRK